MSKLGVGIVGLGGAGRAHLEAFRAVPDAEVRAVCSVPTPDPRELEKELGIQVRVHSDLKSLLADPNIDIVDVCTPHRFHAAQAVQAARAKKHVIIEKPMGLTFQEVKEVRAAVRKARVKACVCFELRFSAQFDLVRSVIDRGLLGEIHYGEIDYFHGIGPWSRQFSWNTKRKSAGSSLLTAGCHALDALLWVMDAPVEEVFSFGAKTRSRLFKPYDYDTTTATILRFKSGKVGKVVSCIDCIQPYAFPIRLIGSEGSLADNRFYSSKLPGMNKNRWSKLEVPMLASGDVRDHPYEPQFRAFTESIKAGKAMPRTGLDAAFETHRVLFAADRSRESRKPVRLSRVT